jgi:predicted dithiol-disulfide oxidoreductase (DUF899 family)
MKDDSQSPAGALALPEVVDRATFQAELGQLRTREKAHTREGDAIAAARRRLPMVEVDAGLTLTGPEGRPARLATGVAVAGRAPHRPVVPARGRTQR